MSAKIKALYEKRANVWEQMKALRDAEGDFTAEQRTEWDKAEADLDTLGGDIERLERAAKIDAIQTKPLADLTQRELSGKEVTAEEKYERAYSEYLVHGQAGMSQDDRQVLAGGEARAQGIAVPNTTTAGGYTVPPGFLVRMTEVLKAYGGLINYAEILNTSTGNPLQFPTNDDTANVGAILAEQSAVPPVDFAFGTKTIGAFMYTSKLVLVSLQLLQDSAFDLNSWLPTRLGIRIGRALAQDLITGAGGSTAPEGIMTNITSAGAFTGTAAPATPFGTTNAAIVSNLIDVQHSIDPAYRANARWVMNDASLKVLRKIVDSNGRPLWEPFTSSSLQSIGTDAPQGQGGTAGVGGSLLGSPLVIDQGVAAPSVTGTKIAAYGDLNQAMIVRQVAGAQTLRLAERYADQLQVGFFGFARYDAKANAAAGQAVRAFVQLT